MKLKPNLNIMTLKPLGIVFVTISLLTFVLIYTGIMKHGIIITIGLNVAMLLVLVQIIAMIIGLKGPLCDFYRMRIHPLYDPERSFNNE
ncbi:MAG: hypothetical protein M8350_05770 [Methanosarcinaceae archaeon]|nr:hypothetical protein [Methanosarcinaceae archaeon]